MNFGVDLEQVANATEHFSMEGMDQQAGIGFVLDSNARPAAPTHLSPTPEKFW